MTGCLTHPPSYLTLFNPTYKLWQLPNIIQHSIFFFVINRVQIEIQFVKKILKSHGNVCSLESKYFEFRNLISIFGTTVN
jgi:hypothetical protein